MKSKANSCSNAAKDHLFETDKSSGVLIFTVDSCDPAHFKFSEKIQIQVIFDQPFSSKSDFICDADVQNNKTISDLQFKRETSDSPDELEPSEKDFSSDNCNISESGMRVYSPKVPSSKCQDNDNHLNGIGYDEGSSNSSFDIGSDFTVIDDLQYLRSVSNSNNNKVSKRKQEDKRFAKIKDMEGIKGDAGVIEVLKDPDSMADNHWIRQQPRRSTRLKTENKSVKTIHTVMKQKGIKNSLTSSISLEKREMFGRKRKKKESTKTKSKIKLDLRKKRFKWTEKKIVDHKLELEQENGTTANQDKQDEKDVSSSLTEDEEECCSIETDEHSANKDVNQRSEIKKKKIRPRKLLLEKNVNCKFCGVTFETKLDFFNHRRMKGSSFTCKICGKEELFEALLMVHMQTHKPDKGQLIEVENEHSKKLVKKKFRMKCDVCGLVVSSLDSLKIHTMTHTGEFPYKCCVCQDQGFFSLSSLRHHLHAHLSAERFQCKPCNMRFHSRADLAKHQLTHEIKCGLCGDIFPNKTSRNCHYRVAHQDDILKCTVCSSLFATDAELQKHMMYHSKGKKEQCPECGVVVVKLKDHMILHSRKEGEKRYACDQCSMRYVSKATLDRHLRTHTGERPYKCDRCTKRFVSHGMLRKHLLTHTAERQFVCDVCGKRCTLRSNLAIHMRIHTNIRPYSCTFCSQAFNYKNSLQVHIKAKHSHQNQSTFNCPHCSQAFQDNASLASHILAKHSGAKVCQDVIKCLPSLPPPPPPASQQEASHMVMEPPPLSFILDHLQAYHHSAEPNNLHNTVHMTNTLDMPAMETAPSLLSRSASGHIAVPNSTLASTGFESMARGELLNYLGRERHSPLGHPTTILPMPPALHLLPMSSMSMDVHQHSNTSNVLPVAQHLPQNNGLIETNVSMAAKNLQLQDSTSLNEQGQYQLYHNL